MKSFIRRMIGILMAFAMLFSSVVMPNPFKEVNLALAENENMPVEEMGEENMDPPTINYVYLKTLYDLCFERAGGEVTTEPSALLEDVWENLLPQEQTLLRELVRGEKVFTVNEETGEVTGVQDRDYSNLPGTDQGTTGNSNQPVDDLENQTPAVVQNIQDPEPELPGGDDDEDEEEENVSGGSDTAGSTPQQDILSKDPLAETLGDDTGNSSDDEGNDNVNDGLNLDEKLGLSDVLTNVNVSDEKRNDSDDPDLDLDDPDLDPDGDDLDSLASGLGDVIPGNDESGKGNTAIPQIPDPVGGKNDLDSLGDLSNLVNSDLPGESQDNRNVVGGNDENDDIGSKDQLGVVSGLNDVANLNGEKGLDNQDLNNEGIVGQDGKQLVSNGLVEDVIDEENEDDEDEDEDNDGDRKSVV